ncbi:hypothetical protein SELMODRAFT_422412 [Selaginella moellendorffii]|uniref:Uncharacterized protein n=1 Tax=Selaginella moellendorffii TaxID=88036 RepID=D8SIB3_SELML|nr:hypothetical protein SELMODRAFT_422412 [Selaginella moellendorffii]
MPTVELDESSLLDVFTKVGNAQQLAIFTGVQATVAAAQGHTSNLIEVFTSEQKMTMDNWFGCVDVDSFLSNGVALNGSFVFLPMVLQSFWGCLKVQGLNYYTQRNGSQGFT